MNKPASTYRIQFHKDFNFQSFDKIIPYLIDLGIDTLYASPIFEAIPGSTHGYDVVNPLRINPEIGTEEELSAISEKLKSAGIGWIQDIVPNHMAFHPANSLLMDVLKKGQASAFAAYFDIDFNQADGRLMVPFLGEDLASAIENKSVHLTEINKEFFLSTGDANWPVNENTARNLPKENLKKRNDDPAFLKKIIAAQHYRLSNWQETNSKINYRRFFTVNSLICLNIQQKEVFNQYHKYIFELIEKGIFQGLRIDHVDGLYDPEAYLTRLRKAVGDDIYIVIEKILEEGEDMPLNWDIQGNTGYDFMSMANNLFTNQNSEKPFSKLYQNIIGKKLNPEDLIYQKKKAILLNHMHGELDNLYHLFSASGFTDAGETNPEELKAALAEFLIRMPVYRYYNYNFPLSDEDTEKVKHLLLPIINQKKTAAAGHVLYQVFIENPSTANLNYNKKLGKFYQRCMQFTGPLMAKGVEDTLMFTYNRFVGHAEVGDAPHAFGFSTAAFHNKMIARQKHWPLTMNGSSTHDTKKGEDVRARLNILSDIPEQWIKFIAKLNNAIAKIQKTYPDFRLLHKNDIYLIIQTIIGALPFPGEDRDDIDNRLEQFIQKALREAKKRSDWAEPDEAYENKLKKFTHVLLDKKQESRMLINNFLNKIADFAVINSLAQQTLKFTCPGIPDVYQGTELWDLSLVDPDNRRPVDYEFRTNSLKAIKNTSIQKLWADRFLGNIKLWLTQVLFKIRKTEQELFEAGAYVPLEIKGKFSDYVFAFARQLKEDWIITVVPLGLAKLSEIQNKPVENIDWADTRLILPVEAPLEWKNLLDDKGGHKDVNAEGIPVIQLFKDLPMAILKLIPKKNTRSAGILMHISSLPSDFGIGDMGTSAFRFIDFLQQSRQKYWQLLPLNPTKAENGYSPYSSNSAMAGNILLISPEGLYDDGLLTAKQLKAAQLPITEHIHFKKAERVKRKLLKKAYLNFTITKNDDLQKEFDSFCITESNWLDNFAIYTALKQHLNYLEWYKWPEKFKYRTTETLTNFEKTHHKEIEEIKWQQFIFFRQWHEIKNYANNKGIQIIGDLPFYLDYDSVEVWSSPENFLLDEKLNKTQVAGVPPDYFNTQGQLWGMPIFNWELMKTDHYSWWLNRLKKNMELYDLLRLDHFRAFASYWQVPAENKDAINGTWQKGAGAAFFETIKAGLGKLPFIAEDLGESAQEVEELIKEFKLPGMKILQFAFDEHVASSSHSPHNFESPECIVYSGTHDNNTIKGWFEAETNATLRKRISAYTGVIVTKKNINSVIIRLCYASVARLAILPIQDVLKLDGNARMNVPGTGSNNWSWRLTPEALNKKVCSWLRFQTELYGRA
ncbi:malto-oligosyltrehalose synthase [Pedobacter rhodius]|uniref:4-alpha-glucanotransferase n=1 Tax=Pedobacter rhodius TaxID=3004098 RepID=A0ABT4KTX3_9SPHI|nr:malto-oligosyltrehalose synthase [Pedobacter sp. SJ11]MCZ4222384.1 malto-oligosyltrehalose synthase [Pedobacter sp. SJ11]